MATTWAQDGNRAAFTSQTSHSMTGQVVNSMTNGVGFVAFIRLGSAADSVTGVTWDGVSMTRVASVINSSPYNYRLYLYALEGANSGTVTITTTTSTAHNSVMWWFTVENAAQQQPEASTTATTVNDTAPSITLSTLTDDALVVSVGAPLNNSNTPTAQTGTTLEQNFFNLQLSWSKPQATAGSNTSGVQGLTAGTETSMIAASVAPVAVSGTTFRNNMILGSGL